MIVCVFFIIVIPSLSSSQVEKCCKRNKSASALRKVYLSSTFPPPSSLSNYRETESRTPTTTRRRKNWNREKKKPRRTNAYTRLQQVFDEFLRILSHVTIHRITNARANQFNPYVLCIHRDVAQKQNIQNQATIKYKSIFCSRIRCILNIEVIVAAQCCCRHIPQKKREQERYERESCEHPTISFIPKRKVEKSERETNRAVLHQFTSTSNRRPLVHRNYYSYFVLWTSTYWIIFSTYRRHRKLLFVDCMMVNCVSDAQTARYRSRQV